MLIDLAKAALEYASWPTIISTGRHIFALEYSCSNVTSVGEAGRTASKPT